MNPIDVIGCYGNRVSPMFRTLLEKAQIVAGSARLLKENSLPADAESVVLDGTLCGVLPDLAERSKTKKLVVLASGDPLFHGIGATLKRFVPQERLRFFPAPAAFQCFFARLGQPWDAAEFYSLHGGEKRVPFRRLLRSPLCAVYGDAECPAGKIAEILLEKYPEASERSAAAGCDLGLPSERILRGTLRQIAQSPEAVSPLSILALLPDGKGGLPRFPLGLPDDGYVHYKNMMTHPEIRTVVLSKLQLAPGVLWDLGAGSGSVGLEAASLCRELQVHSVEKDPLRYDQLVENISREGVPNITPHAGYSGELLDALPVPDRIFIGGGGRELLEACFERLRPGGVLVMTGIRVDTIARMSTVLEEFRKELLMISVSRAEKLAAGGSIFRADNPIAVAVYEKTEGRDGDER